MLTVAVGPQQTVDFVCSPRHQLDPHLYKGFLKKKNIGQQNIGTLVYFQVGNFMVYCRPYLFHPPQARLPVYTSPIGVINPSDCQHLDTLQIPPYVRTPPLPPPPAYKPSEKVMDVSSSDN